MKTLRLTRAEAAAYTAGERRFWRQTKEARCKDSGVPLAPCEIAGEVNGGDYRLCPYGKPKDHILIATSKVLSHLHTITAITVEQRNGRWGWVVEVGA
jgi:hypothetical protein